MRKSRPLHTARLPVRKHRAGDLALRPTRRYPWTPAEDALLGKFRDREVAERVNRTLEAVRDRRKFLGRVALGQAPQPLQRTKEPRDRYACLFAMKSDRELRTLLGWSRKRVRARRRELLGEREKRNPPWSVEEDRLLGTKPDAELARLFGRSVKSVRARRGKKRIRLAQSWRPEDDRILGTRPDRQIAALLGRRVASVAWRRRKLGLPPKAEVRPWTSAEEALLGTESDREVALLLGRSIRAVAARRSGLGRPRPGAPCWLIGPDGVRRRSATPPNAKPGASYCTWRPEDDALLGKLCDEEVARRLGQPVPRVRRRRQLLRRHNPNPQHRHWTPEEIALLGTRPDSEVARLVNRSASNVSGKRLALGIAFHNPHYTVWKPEEVALLGKLPDREVARRTGHSVASTRNARLKRHIPAA